MSKIRSINTLKKAAEKAVTADELFVVIKRAAGLSEWHSKREFVDYYAGLFNRLSDLRKVESRFKTFDEFENELDAHGITASAKKLEEILDRAPAASTSSERELVAFARGRLSGLQNANLVHVSRGN
ncbi:MAG: hypothetical protein WBC07_09170 [Methylotenera sp.]